MICKAYQQYELSNNRRADSTALSAERTRQSLSPKRREVRRRGASQSDNGETWIGNGSAADVDGDGDDRHRHASASNVSMRTWPE